MKSIWINLPVKNLQKSKAFFEEIGFTPNPNYNRNDGASFLLGDQKVVMMLFPEKDFKGFTHNEVADTKKGTEVLLNLDAQSKNEVDEMAKKAQKAGGKIFAEPSESEGWMYVFGFEDLDGHRWSVLHMDMSKMPKQ